MPHNPGRWLVETEWLAEHLTSPDIVVLDGSLAHERGRTARESFEAAHIPGALFFDIAAIADTSNPLPNTLADPVKFSSMMRKMGVGDGTKIIVYDAHGLFSAARVWWNFRAMGHDDVAVLNGGLKKWQAEGRSLEDGPAAARTPKHFTARRQAALICDADDVATALAKGTAKVIDARSPARFRGEIPEDREGLRSGHIPGSVNLHYGALTNADGTLKPADELRQLFADIGLTVPHTGGPARRTPVITTCGSGVTACALVLAMALAGDPTGAVYDGSWTEWGADEDRAIATG